VERVSEALEVALAAPSDGQKPAPRQQVAPAEAQPSAA